MPACATSTIGSEIVIHLANVERTYKTPAGTTWVLRRINLDIQEGEFVTIMGPSGAGKSTLLNVIGMLDDGWTGEYTLLEHPVHNLDRKKRGDLSRQYIGFVFQSYHLLDNLTVYENLDVPLSYRNVSRPQRASMVGDALDRFRIVGKKDLYPNQLSGGQQQLVGIARAVVGNPKVVLADEPTGNLHSSQAKEIMELFRRLNQQGTTIIQVTHSDLNASYGTRVLNLADGWITKDETISNPAPVNA
jgi:ABC-type lipoprotein export system ATPase subunit